MRIQGTTLKGRAPEGRKGHYLETCCGCGCQGQTSPDIVATAAIMGTTGAKGIIAADSIC